MHFGGNAGQVRTLSGDGQLAGGWDTHPTLGFRRAAMWDSSGAETFPLVSPANPNGSGEITAMNNDGSAYAGINSVLGAFVNRDGAFSGIAVPNNNSIPTGLSDDSSIVVGSWGSPFVGGKNPWVWTDDAGAQEAAVFFAENGVQFPATLVLTEMLGVSRDGSTFLVRYQDSGPGPSGAAVIAFPLAANVTSISLSTGGQQTMTLGAGTSRANWFYWIAGLSFVNSVIVIFGGGWSFIVGLGATQIVDGVAVAIAEETGATAAMAAKVGALVADAVISGIFALFGYHAGRRRNWAFVVGMVVYVVDGMLFLLVTDWFSVGFHGFALFCIWTGFAANRKLVGITPSSAPQVSAAAS